MPAPRKFDEEARARAVGVYQDRLRDHGESQLAARRHVGQLLGINPAMLRNWIEAEKRAMRPAGRARRIRLMTRPNCGGCVKKLPSLRRVNEILKTASAFSAQAELDRGLR
jgi:transposase